MKYSFTCPLSGCSHKMTIEAQNDEEAADKLTQIAKEHLKTVHPDVQKTDDDVRNDVLSQMTTVINKT